MKGFWNGLLINLQFFTTIPIKKEIPMSAGHFRWAIRSFPLLGLMLGTMIASAVLLLQLTPVSPLAVAFIIVILTIFLTGGIHLDGWLDCCDGFFSYRDREKRLAIMSDPRAGAFGVIGVILLLACKWLVIYEILLHRGVDIYFIAAIVLIPFYTRMLMGLMLTGMVTAKQEGLASMFKQATGKHVIYFYGLYLFFLISILWMWKPELMWLAAGMLLLLAILYLFLKQKIETWFGGITGDILGAATEGMEVIYWVILWGLHYIVMV